MRFWMDVMRHLEPVLEDHRRLFDAWEGAGVDGLVIGPLFFQGGVPTFSPNPPIYRSLGVDAPPAPAEELPEKRKLLKAALVAARARGWSTWLFQASAGAGPGGGGHPLADPRSRAAAAARIADALAAYPMVDGAIMDGPEWGYEIAPDHMDHRSYLFNDLPESLREPCARLGFDYERLAAARDRLHRRLHDLTPELVAAAAGGGLLGAWQLLEWDADLFDWLRFRVELLTDYFRAVRQGVDAAVGRPVKLGVGPRTAAFAPLCGYDMRALAGFMDILLPKHYFWHRGFDGMYGTVYRYVRTLTRWSPALSDRDALRVVSLLFGLELPGIAARSDFDAGFPPEFFETIVKQETTRALAAVGDPERVVPWVDAGRKPHDGDPIGAGDLRRLLAAARDAGLTRFVYHHHENLTPGEWSVTSELCGSRWEEGGEGYRPPDLPVL
jgi:hypothetical protein